MFRQVSIAAARTYKNKTAISIILTIIVIIVFPTFVLADYQIQRPIIDTGGRIDQTYLWGDKILLNGNTIYHKGVDFPYTTGTQVYAIANSSVVQLIESRQNGEKI